MAKRRIKGEGTVYFDKSRDQWAAQVWIEGRRRKVRGRTKEDVARKVGAIIHGEQSAAAADRSVTVAAILSEWVERAMPARNLSPATRNAYEWSVDQLTDALGKRRASTLRPVDIERALDGMAKHGLSQSSLIKHRSVLNMAMAWATKRGTIPRNPVDGVELPSSATKPKDRRALTPDELRSLLRVLEGHPRKAYYLTMATAGLRPGEASGLCADAVDLQAGVLTISRAVALDAGRPFLTDDLKTAAARRAISLPGATRKALADHIEATGAKGDDLLFPADDGGPLWPSTVRAELAEISEKAGVGRVRPNELRHTAATILTEHLPPHQVADVLGHTTTKMLEQHYRHRPAIVVSGADAFDEVL